MLILSIENLKMSIFGKEYPYFLGYALGGGGARGFAHLGALKVFELFHLKPDVIVGTSAGALAGVFYADGFTPDEIAELFKKRNFREFIEFTVPRSGLFKTTEIERFLKNNLRSTKFEQLSIPFKAVATDWKNATTKVFTKGDNLIEAVAASCSVPMVFKPIEIDGIPYVDGGLLKNFPVSIIRNSCRFVIGVNVSIMTPFPEKINLKTTAERMFKLMSNSNAMADRLLCDILVETSSIERYFMFDLKNIEEIMELGYSTAANEMVKEHALKVVRRCHRRYKIEEKVKEKIKKIKTLS